MADERSKLIERVTVRLDDSLLEKVEVYARRVETVVGVRVARAEILRMLIERGLENTGGDA